MRRVSPQTLYPLGALEAVAMYVMAIIYCVGDVSPLKFFAIGGKFSTGAILVITLACYQVSGLKAQPTKRRKSFLTKFYGSKKILERRLLKLHAF